MQKRAELLETGNLLFTLKEVTYSPETPRLKDPFTVKGKVELFGIPYVAPLWVIAKVTYPETWWEEIIPIWGSPTVGESRTIFGGDFEIKFPLGFDREGEFLLKVEVHLGPTFTLDSITLPPFPPLASEETTFMVAGEALPAGFRELKILSYSKNGGTPVTSPGVLELEVGDICRVNFSFEHRGDAESGKLYAAIWVWQVWDPHDEIIANDKSFSVPSSIDWETFDDYYVDIPITSAIDPGSYGLYGKIEDIPGADIFSSYLEDVITITGIPVKGEFKNFSISWSPDPAVLNYGDKLTVTHHFDYRGPRYTGADIRTAIGNRHHTPLPIIPDWFDEIIYTIAHLAPFGPNEDWRGYDVDVDILITTPISPGVDYDLYSKLTDIPGPDLYDYKDDIIEIVEEALEYEGTITGKWINKAPEGSEIPIPTEVKVDDNTFEVGVRYKNYSGRTVPYCGCKVKVWDPDGILRASPPVDWTGMSDNEELSTEYNICRVDKPGNWTIQIDFLMNSTEKVDSYDGRLFTAVEEGALVPPEVETRVAEGIEHDGAAIIGKLIETSFWSRVEVFFKWGETTSCHNQTGKHEMDEGDEGDEFQAELTGLKPDTKYYYKAAVNALGPRSDEVETSYGERKNFTTLEEELGFTMRVINPPAGATLWKAWYHDQTYPFMKLSIDLGKKWEWDGEFGTKLPPSDKYLYVLARDDSGTTLQLDGFYYRLREGQDYVWDFAAHDFQYPHNRK